MTKHTCKNCNRIFEYCRGCLLSPIPHKDAGFCSKECYEASKNVVVEPQIIEEVVLVEEPEPIVEIEIPTIEPIEEETTVEVDATEAVAPVEIPMIETTTVVEPTIKKETNTYKKKKNKYKYTSSY